MDCGGLRIILMAHQREAGRLIVVQGPRCVQRVFELSGLVGLLPLVDEPPKRDGAGRSTAAPGPSAAIAPAASLAVVQEGRPGSGSAGS